MIPGKWGNFMTRSSLLIILVVFVALTACTSNGQGVAQVPTLASLTTQISTATPTLTATSISATATPDVNCKPQDVAQWLVQRQIGRDQLQVYFQPGAFNTLTALLNIQQVRRDLENLPRPECADKLYYLTIYLYDGMADYFALELANDTPKAMQLWVPRFALFNSQITNEYAPLAVLSGVNIDATVTAIEPTPTATLQPTAAPAPIMLKGDKGGVVQGPIDIPVGVYRVLLSSSDSAATLKLLNGSCDEFFMYTTAANQSDEEVFHSSGCRALIEFDMSSSPWTLTFTPVQ